MRVIAGSAGGIHLQAPRRGVRPTMDRVKAAIFSSLADKVLNARVLDLFAGTGALGIEALSRGATSVIFVDHDRQSISAIDANLARTKLQGRTRQQEVFEFLKREDPSNQFDLIFADPPYEKSEGNEPFTEKLLTNELLPKFLDDDGIFVLEKAPDEKMIETPLWTVTRQKTYGATEVLFLQPKIPARNASHSDAGGENRKSKV